MKTVTVAILLLAGVSVPARAQVAPREFSSFIASAPGRHSLPSQAKWGMIIGGVTGTVLGVIQVSRRPCTDQGWACLLRPMLVLGGAAAGGLVGMMVGGAIGRAIAEDSEFDLAGSRLRVGLRLSLPTRH